LGGTTPHQHSNPFFRSGWRKSSFRLLLGPKVFVLMDATMTLNTSQSKDREWDRPLHCPTVRGKLGTDPSEAFARSQYRQQTRTGRYAFSTSSRCSCSCSAPLDAQKPRNGNALPSSSLTAKWILLNTLSGISRVTMLLVAPHRTSTSTSGNAHPPAAARSDAKNATLHAAFGTLSFDKDSRSRSSSTSHRRACSCCCS
jgi:hypothetical protein